MVDASQMDAFASAVALGLPPVAPSVVDNLVSLHSRLALLNDSLNDFYLANESVPWPEILAKFSVLNSRCSALLKDIQLYLRDERIVAGAKIIRFNPLRNVVALPSELKPGDPDFVPRVLLRTKLIPQLEDLEAQLCGHETSDDDGNAISSSLYSGNPVSTDDDDRELLRVKARVNAFDDIIKGVLSNIDSIAKRYDFKMRIEDPEDDVLLKLDLSQSKSEKLLMFVNRGPDYTQPRADRMQID